MREVPANERGAASKWRLRGGQWEERGLAEMAGTFKQLTLTSIIGWARSAWRPVASFARARLLCCTKAAEGAAKAAASSATRENFMFLSGGEKALVIRRR